MYDHLYQKNFGIDANVVLIEGDDVAHEDLLSASLVFSDHMRQIQNVARVQSLADMVADAEYQNNGVRRIPSQWRIEEILVSSSQAQLGSLMTDRSHSRMIVGMPATLDESERNEVLSEIYKSLDIAEFPPGYETTVTGDPAFQASVVEIMYDSNASILALAGLLMVVALLLIFNMQDGPFFLCPSSSWA